MHLTAEQLVHQFWIATVAGCYASHGESFVTRAAACTWSKAGGCAVMRRRGSVSCGGILDDLVGRRGSTRSTSGTIRRMSPASPREQYLQYLGRAAPAEWSFRLPRARGGARLEVGDVFEVDIIDTWNMTSDAAAGRFVLDDVQRNDAYARAAAPLVLPRGEALALRITRVQGESSDGAGTPSD